MKRISLIVLCLVLVASLAGCGNDSDSRKISFSDMDYSAVQSGILRNMHNGQGTYISDAESIRQLCALLRSVRGIDGQSGKGYYEGSYTLTLYANESPTQAVLKEETPLFSICFGDSDAFFYGEGTDGYPVRYSLSGISIDEVIETLSQFDLS